MAKQQLALIIPAAGSGTRLHEEIPKPYLQIAGKTILEHTLLKFAGLRGLKEVVVSTSAEYVDQTGDILKRLFRDKTTYTVLGGKERQHSISNALEKISDHLDLVAVHDAVRPFVEPDIIELCLQRAKEAGGAIAAVPAKDTIKIADQHSVIVNTPGREVLWQAQTPQAFQMALFKSAYSYAQENGILGTDDAFLVEKIGGKVVIVEGSRENFKITYPLDLQLAKLLLEKTNR